MSKFPRKIKALLKFYYYKLKMFYVLIFMLGFFFSVFFFIYISSGCGLDFSGNYALFYHHVAA